MDNIIGSELDRTLDDFFNELRIYSGLFYSFDVMFNQIDWVNFGWRGNKHHIYNYLRSRGDVVLSLLRDKKEIFFSIKSLEITNKAHFTPLDCAESSPTHLADRVLDGSRLELNCNEYLSFSEQLEEDRRILAKSFRGYDRFIEFNYSDIISGDMRVFNSVDKIVRDFGYSIGYEFAAALNPFPKLIRHATDYRRIFTNVDEILSLD